jgi:hypothetical protein
MSVSLITVDISDVLSDVDAMKIHLSFNQFASMALFLARVIFRPGKPSWVLFLRHYFVHQVLPSLISASGLLMYAQLKTTSGFIRCI